MPVTSAPLDLDTWAAAIRAGNRGALARAITLVESAREDHAALAHRLVQALLPDTGRAHRIGITGAPGVGKSTLIDTLGTHLTQQGRKVAVLAVDPSSTLTGGSILGDKTRMTRLANDPNAFVRPSPSAGTLGGVAARSRETMLLCEAAGYDVVIVETVGIGQSETAVAGMTDVFLVLLMPGAGDELQGLKKGVIELSDAAGAHRFRPHGRGHSKIVDGAGAASRHHGGKRRRRGTQARATGAMAVGSARSAPARDDAHASRAQATIAGDRGGCRRRPAFTHAGDRGNQQTAGFVMGP
jgi:LAO/AO transport system kinase